ncbi:hypothetical protein B0H17DRAFT_1147322 [Mycena rosella]|uniref:Uncharacterized protein n=1 Tax=Mycena rosella TaxID=1033263 RepID=A0AAD7G3Y2_MYCRO|nr:hypothetical protein B0H17DRAFT_1147322 [Mycena rosella]
MVAAAAEGAEVGSLRGGCEQEPPFAFHARQSAWPDRTADVGAVGADEKRGGTLKCGGSTAVPIVATPGADEADGGGSVASGAFAKGSASTATAAASAAGAGSGATGSSVGLGRRARCGACGGGSVARLTGLQKRRATKAAALEAGEPSLVETVIKDSSSEASATVAGVYDEKRKREESRVVVHDQEEVTRSRRSRTTTAILAPFAYPLTTPSRSYLASGLSRISLVECRLGFLAADPGGERGICEVRQRGKSIARDRITLYGTHGTKILMEAQTDKEKSELYDKITDQLDVRILPRPRTGGSGEDAVPVRARARDGTERDGMGLRDGRRADLGVPGAVEVRARGDLAPRANCAWKARGRPGNM